MASLNGSALRAEPRLPPIERQQAGVIASAAEWLTVPWTDGDPHVRHSRRVALLKRLLPAIGVSLLLLISVWPRLAPLWDRMRVAFPAIDLRDARELDMINPRYAGVDREGRPYIVTAASGRQLPDRQDLMSLHDPKADMKSHSGVDIVVTAETGIYQSQTQLLDLFDDVTLTHQNGTRFVTQSARVNAATGQAEGDKPVEGHGPSGDIKSEGFRVLDKGDKILFTGHADLLLRSARQTASTSPPAALPAPVAADAARTLAEAKPLLASAAPAMSPLHIVPAVARQPVATAAARPESKPHRPKRTAARAGHDRRPAHSKHTVAVAARKEPAKPPI